MLVRASLISALLLTLVAEAGAQDRARNSPAAGGNSPNLPENGQNRGPSVDDLFGSSAPPAPVPAPAPVLAAPAPALPVQPGEVIRNNRERIDESGLRYFASQNNTKRVEKEIQRLKSLYPEWTPPDDLYLGASGGPEEQPFWDLFAQDKVQEIRQRIAEKIKAEPKWKPSQALLYKIERKESRLKLVAAFEAKQWRKVIETAAADPKILSCSDIDVQWRVADAFASIGQKSQTFEVYRYILGNCRDRSDRLATLKKSLAYFEPREIDVLVAMGTRNADGGNEFDDIRIDLTRIRLGRAAVGKAPDRSIDADVDFFEQNARKKTLSGDASLVGWYRLSRKQPETAVAWFRQAMEWPVQLREDGVEVESQAKMAEGHILSLKALEKFDEAEELATRWAPVSDGIKALLMEIVGDALLRSPAEITFAPQRLSSYEINVSALRSKFGAQAVGWYYYRRSNWADAANWFQSSLSWQETAAPIAAAPGAAEPAASEPEKPAAPATGPARGAKVTAKPAQTAAKADTPPAKDARSAAPAPPLAAKNPAGAKDDEPARTQAPAQAPVKFTADDVKTAEGLANALRNAFRFEEAEKLAYEWRDRSPTILSFYLDIFAESLVRQSAPISFSPERIERYAAVVNAEKSVVGAQGLAWYHHDRAQWKGAINWFRSAIDWSADQRGDDKLAEGYAQSLRRDGQFEAAADIAYDWRDHNKRLRALFFDISAEQLGRMPVTEQMPRERLDRFGELAVSDRSAQGASAIGWHYYDRKIYSESLKWFRSGLDYGPEGLTLFQMREGFILSLRYAGEIDEAEDRAYEWRDDSEKLQRAYFEIASETISRLRPPAEYPGKRLVRLVELASVARSSFGAQAIGWYFNQRGDHQAAAEWFSQSLAWGGKIPDTKTAQGYLLALIALGRLEEADRLAFELHEKSEEFRTVYIDAFGGAILRLEAKDTFPAQMLRRFEHIASYSKSVFGAQAVGWYHYDRRAWADAARWFEASLTWAGAANHDQKTVEGFSQAIRYLGRREEAENILFAWRDRNPQLRKLYTELFAEGLVNTTAEVFFSDERLNRYADVVLNDRNGFGAQALAWYRLDRRQWPDAVRWFKYAREWSKDAAGDAKMAEGLAFALRNLDLYDESEQVSAPWKDSSPSLRKLFSETVGEYLVRLKPENTYPNDRMERYLETVSRDVNNIGAQSAGWYFYARDMFEPAAQWFWASLQWGPDKVRDPKTVTGYITSLRKLGRLAEAETTAFDWIDRSPAFRQMYIDIAAEVLAGLKPPATHPGERLARLAELVQQDKSVSGANGLAWYHQTREEWQSAGYWFERGLEWRSDVDDIKVVEGYVIALIGLGRYDEAETLVVKWRERSDKIAGLYIDTFGGALLRLPQGQAVPEARLAKYQFLVGEEKSVWGAQAIAWYYFDRVNWKEAARWFEASLAWTRDGAYDAKTVEGFAQSIRYFARREEAEDHLYPWRDKIPAMRKLYIELVSEALVLTTAPIVLPDERINRYAEVVLKDKDSFGAQGLAWYRHDRRQWPDSVRWFKYAREWSSDGKGDAKMAEGLAFALRNLDLYDESETVSAEWKERVPALRKLYSETVGEYLVRMKPEHSYPNERMQRFLETVSIDRNNIGAQSAGWYYHARDMFDPAAEWFLASLQWGPDLARDPKTAEGYVTALRRTGRLQEAEAAAFELRDRSPSMRALYFDIAGEVLAAMKPPADFPAERLGRFVEMAEDARSVPGALAIAWYHQAREDWREATFWFERALEWNGDTRDPKVAEGYIVALTGLGRHQEAENLVHQWRLTNPEIARTFLDVFGGALLKLGANQAMPPDRLERYGVIVGLEKSAFGAQALAWYHTERNQWSEAVRWFQTSLGWTPAGTRDTKNIEGFAQALRHAGRRDEAEDLFYQWRASSPGMMKLYVEAMAESLVQQDAPIAFPDHRLDRYAQVVLNERSASGAQALGWYRFNRKVWPDAVRWFKSARVWSADGKGDAKLAEGLAAALRNMNMYDESETVSWEWRDRAPSVRKLYVETIAEYIVRLKDKETYPVDRMSRYQAILSADRSSIGAQAAGWYYFARNNFADASNWFRNALDWGPDSVRDPKTAEGLAVALRNAGQFDAAEALAYEWRARAPRFADLYAELAAEAMGRLATGQTYDSARMARIQSHARATRSPFAAQAIGWYHAARTQWSEAAEWFRLAMDFSGELKDVKTVEGYALALRNLGRIDEAEALALAWKDKADGFVSIYLETVIDRLANLKPGDVYPSDKLAAFTRLVQERQSVAGAQAIAWYRLNANAAAEAETWFRNAMAWGGDKRDIKLVEGHALALQRLGKFAELETLSFDLRDSSEAMRELYRTVMIEQMVKTKPPAALPADRLRKFAEFAQGLKNADAARSLAWYAYDRKDWAIAQQWFRIGTEWETNPKNTKSAEGYALTLKNMGKLEEAEAFAYEWRDKSDEMRSLYIDFVPEMLAKLETGKTFPADRLNRFAAQVTTAKSAYGAQSLAWYRLQRNDQAQALIWFKNAFEWSGDAKDPKMAEGYVLALRATGQLDNAEAVAFEWRDRADSLRQQYIEVFAEALTKTNPPPAFPAERLARYAQVISADKSAVGAQALGWYSLNIKQVRPARAWFEKAMQWTPSEGSALGLALSARAMKDTAGFNQIIMNYRSTYPKLGELLNPSAAAGTQTFATTPIVPDNSTVRVIEEVRTVRVPARTSRQAASSDAESGTRSPSRSNAACITDIEARQRAGTATAQDMVAKGWCLLNADRPQEAAQAFERGRGVKSEDSAYGRALSKLRSGETDEAAAIGENVTSAKRRNDIGVQVLQQRAVAAQRSGRYVEALHYLDQRAAFAGETRDGSMMRGWALWNLGRKDAARRIFTELDRQLSTNETQNALGVVNDVRGN